MVRRTVLLVVLAVLLAPASAWAGTFAAPPEAPRLDGPQLPAGFTDTTAFQVPEYATAVRFAPDGHVFVAAKEGIVYEFDGLGDRTPTVYADLSRQVMDMVDRGLLGLAVDPDFTTGRPYIYVAYTYDKAPGDPTVPRWSDVCANPDDGCPAMGRVSRIGPDGTETVLLEDFCDQSLSHSMGTLAFGPDHALYVSAGDGASFDSPDWGQTGRPVNPCGDPPGGAGTALQPPDSEGGALRAQSFDRPAGQPATLNGAILRIDPDTGAAQPSNPAAGNADPNRRRIVAYGFRNPFRFTFRPGTGELWVGDVGFGAWEEIDRVPDVSTVRDYGWPCMEGDVRQDSYEPVGLNVCQSLYSRATDVHPFYAYSHRGPVQPQGDPCPTGSSSLSGISFYDASAFPAAYRGALFFADYSRSCIWVMYPDANGVPDPATRETFESGAAGPVDLQVGPDGALYYADVFEGQVHRIGTLDGAPAATILADHVTGGQRTVTFDGTHSSDPNGQALTYAWDLDGDGDYDDSTAAKPSFAYTHNGYVTVGLRVTDASGLSGTATLRITVGTPPAVTIDSPSPDLHWAAGDTIAYSGSGPRLHWTLDLRHCARFDPTSCHTHRIGDVDGASGSFAAPDHEYPSHLELTATATDDAGLKSSATVRLDPRTVALTVDSAPEGARVAFGSEAQVTPFTDDVIANSVTVVTAGSPQTIGGASYVFGAWNDGGDATRALRALTPATYTVRFDRQPDTLLAGTEEVGTAVSTAFPGRGEVYRMPPAARSGTVMAMRLRLDEQSTAHKLTLGIYTEADSDHAGVLLASGTLLNPVAGRVDEVRLDTPVAITAGQRYWFAVLNPYDDDAPLRWRDQGDRPDGEGEWTSQSLQLQTLPGNWALGLHYLGAPISGGAYGVLPAAPSPTVTATSTPLPLPQVTPVPTPVATPKPLPQLPKLRVPSKLRMSKGGVLAIKLSTPQVCRYTATISYAGKRLGRATARGRTVTLRVHLNARGRNLVRRHKRLRVRLTREFGGRTQAVSSSAAPSSRATSAA